MKKIFNSMLLLLLAGTSMVTVSCKDDDNVSGQSTDRQFMTMFITDNTRGKGDDYPYNCGVDLNASPNGNTIHLYWFGVNDCAGYQIQMSLQSKVSTGASAWAAIQGTSDLLLDTIVGPDVLDMRIRDLMYSTNYRFAIRALSKQDDNIKGNESSFAHASNWYGHGNGREWQEYLGIQTYDRYETPYAVYVDQSQTTEEDMHVYFNTDVRDIIKDFEGCTDEIEAALYELTEVSRESILSVFSSMTDEDKDKLEEYYQHFNIDEHGTFGYKYLMVSPSPSNPNSTVNSKWTKYEILPEDRERGYVVVDGLTANSVYVIDVVDPTISVEVDAKYNTRTARSDGQPGEPILLSYDELYAQAADLPLADDNDGLKRNDVFALATSKYQAAPITPALYDFISNVDYAEGQEFQLEGGKVYYMDGNDVTSKGFVLRTRPEDVAAGKRAKVICGIGKHSRYDQATNGEQWQGPYSMFIFGRSPEAGEGGEIYMKKLAFYDIDFDNPEAFNYGDQQAGLGTAAGNYFFNMFSDGMAVTLDSLVIENCTFKRIVRGFLREQGPNYKVFNHVLIKNNQFFDSGYYNQGGGGYPMIAGSGTNAATNFYKDMKVIENTFYDSPFPAFFSEETVVSWTGGPWNITFSNNTLINFNTRASGAIIKMRGLPDGSVYNVENNLFVLTKQDGDQRVLQMWGADIRDTQTLSDGSAGYVTLNFNNNWSTSDNLTNGSIFSANAWTSTSNNFGKLIKDGNATLNGTLEVNVANISSTDLMVSPCPPHKAATANDQNMHRADALDGTATTQYNVNLYFKDKNNDIYKNNVGAARWRNGQ